MPCYAPQRCKLSIYPPGTSSTAISEGDAFTWYTSDIFPMKNDFTDQIFTLDRAVFVPPGAVIRVQLLERHQRQVSPHLYSEIYFDNELIFCI